MITKTITKTITSTKTTPVPIVCIYGSGRRYVDAFASYLYRLCPQLVAGAQHAHGRTPYAAPPTGRMLSTAIQKKNEKN